MTAQATSLAIFCYTLTQPRVQDADGKTVLIVIQSYLEEHVHTPAWLDIGLVTHLPRPTCLSKMTKQGFYRIELNKTVWEVPERYQNLSPVGSGAYGQVTTIIELPFSSKMIQYSIFDLQVCSATDSRHQLRDGSFLKVAIKKLARPFQSAIHAKRTYRELRMLKHMNHENVRSIKYGVFCRVF